MVLLKQIISNTVTAINLSSGVVGTGNNTVGNSKAVCFPIQQDISKKHYAIISYTISFSNSLGNYLVNYGISSTDINNLKVGDKIYGTYSGETTSGTTNYYNYPAKSIFISPKYVNDTIISNANCVINYGDLLKPIIISNIINSFVDYRKEFILTFSTKNQKNMFDQFSIVSGILKYREKGTTGEYYQIQFTGNQITIPSNSLQNGKMYECYATCTVDDDQVADSPMIELTTVDATPTVIPIEPINSVTYGNVMFSWNYINSTGTEQYAFDLQISNNGDNFVNLDDHVTTSTTNVSHIMEAGTWHWKVRVYNQNDIASEWSTISKFINNVPPPKPTLTQMKTSGRPTFYWDSLSQLAYQVIIDELYDSGEVYTSDKFCFVNEYIPNGVYLVKIRIINEYGKSSDWLEFEYSQNMNVQKPIATITNTENGAFIYISKNYVFSKYYIYRDDICIAKTSEAYLDRFVNGKSIYLIRGITSDDTFSDLILQNDFKSDKSKLISLNGDVYDLSFRLSTKPIHNVQISRDVATLNYLGREKPVHNEGTIKYKTFSVQCITDFNNLGVTMFYRNVFGDLGFVKCNQISKTNNDIEKDVQLTLEETDYDEEIEYDL